MQIEMVSFTILQLRVLKPRDVMMVNLTTSSRCTLPWKQNKTKIFKWYLFLEQVSLRRDICHPQIQVETVRENENSNGCWNGTHRTWADSAHDQRGHLACSLKGHTMLTAGTWYLYHWQLSSSSTRLPFCSLWRKSHLEIPVLLSLLKESLSVHSMLTA